MDEVVEKNMKVCLWRLQQGLWYTTPAKELALLQARTARSCHGTPTTHLHFQHAICAAWIYSIILTVKPELMQRMGIEGRHTSALMC